MKTEYDFSKAERGKFFRWDASLGLPVYLDAGVRAYLTELAKAKGIPVSDLVNDFLRHHIELTTGKNRQGPSS